MMNRIAIIIPWYGKLPNYFPFFLKGCEHNKSIIDILFFTDQNITIQLPENVLVHNLSWENLQKVIAERLNASVIIESSYKLCDYKPMLGHIFEAYVKSYEFWGYGDIDIIYGDLQKYITPKILNKYDIITFREYIISGALTILKNNDYTRTLFQKSPDIQFVYSSKEYVSFDESGKKKTAV